MRTLRYQKPSMPLARHVCSGEYRFALAFAPATVSAKSQLRRPTTRHEWRFAIAIVNRASAIIDVARKLDPLGGAIVQRLAEKAAR